jgi:hypothetical protein
MSKNSITGEGLALLVALLSPFSAGATNLERGMIATLEKLNRMNVPCTVCSAPQLINGVVIDRANDPYPQVVKLEIEGSRCTATVTGKGVLVASAHCLPEKTVERSLGTGRPGDIERQVMVPRAKVNGRMMEVSKAYVTAAYKKKGDPGDILAIQIKGDSLDSVEPLPISLTPAPEEGELKVIGYSPFESNVLRVSGNGAKVEPGKLGHESKKWGKVVLAMRDSSTGWIYSLGKMKEDEKSTDNLGRDVGLAQQDSGGPLLRDDLLVGVAASVTYRLRLKPGSKAPVPNFEYNTETQQNVHEDFSSERNQKFFRRMVELGLPIEIR